MTTTIVSAIVGLHSKPTTICQVEGLSPSEAIERLDRSGILAISDEDSNVVFLLGYTPAIRKLLREYRIYGYALRGSRSLPNRLRRLNHVSPEVSDEQHSY